MLVKLECPQCGAKMEVDDSREKVFCSYCGMELVNFTQHIDVTQNVNVSGAVMHITDRSNEPNVIIDFASVNPVERLTVSFSNTTIKRFLTNGQSTSLKLPLGKCKVSFLFPKRGLTYREIYIVEDAPVRINVTCSSKVAIEIDQPPYELMTEIVPSSEPTRGAVSAAPKKPAAPREKASAISIIGFVLAVTMYLAPLGMILGIIDLIKNKKKPHGLSIAAICIGLIMTFFIGLVILMYASGLVTMENPEALLILFSNL